VVTGSWSVFGDGQYGANKKLPVPMKSAELICCPENGNFLRNACRYQFVRCHLRRGAAPLPPLREP
jgi:hypothetical protein